MKRRLCTLLAIAAFSPTLASASLACTFAPLMIGSTTCLTKSESAAEIREEFVRRSLLLWEGPRVFAVKQHSIGLNTNHNSRIFIVEPGNTRLETWFYGRVGTPDKPYAHTEPVLMSAKLRPSGRYVLRSSRSKRSVVIRLIDEATGEVVASSGELELLHRDRGIEYTDRFSRTPAN
jgi:hypothetical protein